MDDDIRQLRGRWEILHGYAIVMDDPLALFELCLAAEGGADGARTEIRERFGLSDVQAEAILLLQLRRFTPAERQRMLDELEDLERRLDAEG